MYWVGKLEFAPSDIQNALILSTTVFHSRYIFGKFWEHHKDMLEKLKNLQVFQLVFFLFDHGLNFL